MSKQNKLSNPEHSIFHHQQRLKDWHTKQNPLPVSLGLSLTNTCNHNCPGCRVGARNDEISDYPDLPEPWGQADKRDPGHEEVPPVTISPDDFKDLITQFTKLQGKAVSLGAEGEPTIHPQFSSFLYYMKNNGLDISLYTNGEQLNSKKREAILKTCTFVNISIDAPNPEVYKLTHGMEADNFNKMIDNLKKLVEEKQQVNSKIRIITSFLLGKYTSEYAKDATLLAREIGVDRIYIRPYWFDSPDNFDSDQIRKLIQTSRECEKLSKDDFDVFTGTDRLDWLQNSKTEREYSKCEALKFQFSVSADLKIYPCCWLLGDPEYLMGDLQSQSLVEIWQSKQRKNVIDKINDDFSKCPTPCGGPHRLNKVLAQIKSNEISPEDFPVPDNNPIDKNFI